MWQGPRSSLFPLANMDLCAQDSVFSASSSCLPFLPRPLHRSTVPTSSFVCTLNLKIFPRKNHIECCLSLEGISPSKMTTRNNLVSISVPTHSAMSCFVLSFLMQSLVFCTARRKFDVIQKCHSASRLILKHYHTNKGRRTKGSELMSCINPNNSVSKLHASQPR